MPPDSSSSPRAARRRKLIVVGIILILCLPLCVAGGYVYSGTVPRVYYSKATLAVEPVIPGAEDRKADAGIRPKRSLIVESKELLYPAIDELDLGKKWAAGTKKISNEEVYSRLLTMLVVNESAKSDFVEIGIYSGDAQEAADVANAIAARYRKRIGEDGVKGFDLQLKDLDNQIDIQQRRVDNAQVELDKIRTQNSIVDPAPEMTDPQANNFADEYVSAKKTYLEEKKKLDENKARYEKQLEPGSFPQPAVILENAVPPTIPARPNVTLILMISAGVGLLFAIPGLVLLVKGLSIRVPQGNW